MAQFSGIWYEPPHHSVVPAGEALFNEGNADQELLVSPDNEWVVFRTRDDATSAFRLYSANLFGAARRQVNAGDRAVLRAPNKRGQAPRRNA
jgi:hypothetical protein